MWWNSQKDKNKTHQELNENQIKTIRSNEEIKPFQHQQKEEHHTNNVTNEEGKTLPLKYHCDEKLDENPPTIQIKCKDVDSNEIKEECDVYAGSP